MLLILDPFLPFWTLFWPLVIFEVKFLYIVICEFINCVNMPKNALINGISMGIFKIYHFWPILDLFMTLFWPLLILGVKFIYIFLCAYINCVIMLKIALINGISMGIFNFYNFFTYFGPFLTLFLAFGYNMGQFSIDFHMRIYKLCNNAKNGTHKWYFYGHF